jgi:hypothetical protein
MRAKSGEQMTPEEREQFCKGCADVWTVVYPRARARANESMSTAPEAIPG